MSKVNLGWVVGVMACVLKFQHVDRVILMNTQGWLFTYEGFNIIIIFTLWSLCPCSCLEHGFEADGPGFKVLVLLLTRSTALGSSSTLSKPLTL